MFSTLTSKGNEIRAVFKKEITFPMYYLLIGMVSLYIILSFSIYRVNASVLNQYESINARLDSIETNMGSNNNIKSVSITDMDEEENIDENLKDILDSLSTLPDELTDNIEKESIENSTIEEVVIEERIEDFIGKESFDFKGKHFKEYDLPDKYYRGLDFSSFQPYMDYRKVTNRQSMAYAVNSSKKAYTDNLGLRRYKILDGEFSVNGEDHYTIALGNFYKKKGSAGGKYLIVTTTGMYTAIVGDEKADIHTDSRKMFSRHGGGKAGMIEWLVDTNNIEREVRRSGSVANTSVEAIKGKIIHIYEIS